MTRQIATAWDGVALEIVRGALFEDDVCVATADNKALLRGIAYQRALQRKRADTGHEQIGIKPIDWATWPEASEP